MVEKRDGWTAYRPLQRFIVRVSAPDSVKGFELLRFGVRHGVCVRASVLLMERVFLFFFSVHQRFARRGFVPVLVLVLGSGVIRPPRYYLVARRSQQQGTTGSMVLLFTITSIVMI